MVIWRSDGGPTGQTEHATGIGERPIQHLAVVGAGTMGSQIAQQAALRGFDVALHDEVPAQLERAVASNRHYLGRRVAKGTLSEEEMEAAVARVRLEPSLEAAVVEADLVIEAIVEQLDAKRVLFTRLDQLARPEAILASNSSTMVISEIAGHVAGRERAVSMHFFNPVLVMRLVEIAPAPFTRPEVIPAAVDFCRRIDREPVVLHREVTAFLVNRILNAIRREAMWLAEGGYADPKDIDTAVKLGLNHPMGPFELADFNGLDVVLAAARHWYARTGDEADRPPKVLEELVAAGHLGRKTGKGFYDYAAEGSMR